MEPSRDVESAAGRQVPAARQRTVPSDAAVQPTLVPDVQALVRLQQSAGNHAAARLLTSTTPAAARGPVQALAAPGSVFSYEVDLPVGGAGRPLAADVRQPMEDVLGHELGDVTMHDDGLPEQIGARAFTRGNEIHLAHGEDPESTSGRHLLGHELAHVAQQREGRVAGPPSGGGVVADAALEGEADRIGAAFSGSPRPEVAPSTGRPRPGEVAHPVGTGRSGAAAGAAPIQGAIQLGPVVGAAIAALSGAKAVGIATVVAAAASVTQLGQAVAAGTTGVQGVTLPGNQVSEGDQVKLRQILQFEIINRYCDRFIAAHPELDTDHAPAAGGTPSAPAAPPVPARTPTPAAAPAAATPAAGSAPTGAPTGEAIDAALMEAVRLEVESEVVAMWRTAQGASTEYVWSEANDEEHQTIGITGAVQFTAMSGQVISRTPALSATAQRIGISLASPGPLVVRRFVGGRLDIGPSFTRSRWDDLAINVAGGGPVITAEGPANSVMLKLRTNWSWDNNTTTYDWKIVVSDTGAPVIQEALKTGVPDDSRFF